MLCGVTYVPYINIPGNRVSTYTHGVSREKRSRFGFLTKSLRLVSSNFVLDTALPYEAMSSTSR